MLGHFIAQLQHLLQLQGSSTDTSHYFLQLHPPPPPSPPPPVVPPLDHPEWCLLNIKESSTEVSCCHLIMTAGKSENLKMLDPGKPPPAKKTREEQNKNRITTTASSIELDQHLWKEFPEDLFEAVMARFPIETFFRFRSVCRKWNSMLNSQSFSEQYAQIPRAQQWFYTIENLHTGTVYDPTLKKWHRMIPPLPTNLIALPVASAGGLVCFLTVEDRNFYVCNPLTRSFRELPARPFNVSPRNAVGMTLTGKSANEGYKILWVGNFGEYQVYDSSKNCWIYLGAMPSHIKLPLALNFRSQAVSTDGTFYFIRSHPDGIVSYDVSSGVWGQSIIPFPLHLRDGALAECGGKLMLVGLLTKNAATCVCVWELQKMTLLWKEVDRMPNILCLEFYGKHIKMSCMGNKGLLMLSLSSREMDRLITYNLSSHEWLKVPGCMSSSERKKHLIGWGTGFHPCLMALP